jgi:hypothetical protein
MTSNGILACIAVAGMAMTVLGMLLSLPGWFVIIGAFVWFGGASAIESEES